MMSPDFTDPHFADAAWLWLLPPTILALAALFIFASRMRRRALAEFASPAMLTQLLTGHSPARRFTKSALLVAGVVLIIAGLARPQWGSTPAGETEETEDILFLIDTSRSMDAKDVAPTRLDRAKRSVESFVSAHPSGRIGIVAFAGEAYLQCPATSDRDIFEDVLRSLDTSVIPTPGTDIGSALTEAVAAFGVKEGRRTIILITDGEDLEGRGVDIARKLAREGVIIHTVGIGGAQGSKLRDSSGREVVTRLDEKTLRDIAESSGGEYFRLGGPDDNFGAVEAALGRTVGKAPVNRVAIDRFEIPLALAAGLLAIEYLLGTRRRTGRATRSRATTGTATALIALLAILTPDTSRAASAGALYDDGSRALEKGDYAEAEKLLRDAVAQAGPDLRARALHNLAQARARSTAKTVDASAGVVEHPLAAGTTEAQTQLGRVQSILDQAAGGAFDKQAAQKTLQESEAAHKALGKTMKDTESPIKSDKESASALERARDDFLGAHELNPNDSTAKSNAESVERYREKLLRRIDAREDALRRADEKSKALKEANERLKKLLEDQGGGGSDKDQKDSGKGDDKSDKGKQSDKDKNEKQDGDQGDKSGESKDPKDGGKPGESGKAGEDKRTAEQRRAAEGREGRMSREEAASALEAMRRDLGRHINMGALGQKEGKPSRSTPEKDW